MEVKPGYKQTEVGVIPDDWEVRPLATLADKIMVGIASAATHAYRTKGVPMFRNQNIKDGHLDDSDLLFIAPEYEVTFKNKRLRGGDLLTMRTGYPGVTAIVPPRYEFAQSFTTLITRPKQSEAASSYLCHFINSEIGQRFFTQSQIGGAQKNVNAGTLRKMPVPLPEPPEQRVIAEALSDVEGLLGGLDRLIAKKRDLKQAAMQQLLTGQTRLPGFHGEWEMRRLGEEVTLLSGQHILAQYCNTQGEGIPYLTGPSDFPEGRIRHTKFTNRPGTICSAQDILVTVKGSGSGTIVVADAAYCISRQLMAIRVGNWDCLFVYYSLMQNSAQFKAASTGLIPGLSRTDILDHPLPFPPTLPEQAAIAEVLTEMDKELAALEQRREKTLALKQAMMQELLTGKARLV